MPPLPPVPTSMLVITLQLDFEVLATGQVPLNNNNPKQSNGIKSGAPQYLCIESTKFPWKKGLGMFQKANSSGDFSGNCFDLLFPVKRAVNLYTKVLDILNFFKFITANFQNHTFILTLKNFAFLFSRKKHGMRFCNI